MSQDRKRTYRNAAAVLGIAATLAYAAPTITSINNAHASGGRKGGMSNFGSGGSGEFNITDPVTARECGDCHIAFGPETLPRGTWVRVMADLPNHFGEDASLNEKTRQHIENYLTSNAPDGDSQTLRITEQRWFIKEHRGEVSQAQKDRAKSMANCKACHGRGKR